MLLSINTTPAEIAIETKPGHTNVKARDAKLELRQKQPKLNIKTEQPKLLIDQYQCFADAGLKNNFDFIKTQAQKGYSKVMQYTAKEARDGDAMARIGHKANIMINIIKRESVTRHEFGLGTMPKSRPKIDVVEGKVDINPEFINNPGEINGVSGSYTPADIDFNYTPAVVDIRMVSYGSVDIKYLGNNVDGYI